MVAFSLLFFLPFTIRFENPHTRSIVLKHVFYYLISGKQSTGQEDSTAIALWKYVALNIRNPQTGERPKELPAMKILQQKWGSCDQQAILLTSMARAHGLDGRLIFLYGEDSISHHSVAEIKTGKSFKMYDPYYGIIFKDSQNRVLSVEELKKNNEEIKPMRLDKKSSFNPKEYKRLFGRKYPQKIKSDNKIGVKNSVWLSLVKFSCDIYGSYFYNYWLTRQCIEQGECYYPQELAIQSNN